jgi:hypothetical protein
MCLFEFIRVKGGVKFMKYFKGVASYTNLGTSGAGIPKFENIQFRIWYTEL